MIWCALVPLICWVPTLQVRARLRETDRAVAIEEARDALVPAQAQQVRLSHGLHDGVIQSLYAVQLGLTQTATTCRPSRRRWAAGSTTAARISTP
jgi:signal transduction histidine kinase